MKISYWLLRFRDASSLVQTNGLESKFRPDLIFFAEKNDVPMEVGSAEVKLSSVAKAELDNARKRVLLMAKRQLHCRMKTACEKNELVTFGAIIHGM